jgi:hypothetical protein
MVKDGYWRTEGEEGEKAAWEESVRLRERMFWARIGGGVVPAFVPTSVHARDSPRSSSAEDETNGADKLGDSSVKMKSHEEEKREAHQMEADPFYSSKRRVSIAKTVICVGDDANPDRSSGAEPGDDKKSAQSSEAHTSDTEGTHGEKGDGSCSNGSNTLPIPELMISSSKGERRLSLTIPGAL